jgi:hypothetical protein
MTISAAVYEPYLWDQLGLQLLQQHLPLRHRQITIALHLLCRLQQLLLHACCASCSWWRD